MENSEYRDARLFVQVAASDGTHCGDTKLLKCVFHRVSPKMLKTPPHSFAHLRD
jgi:hypothetical protein